MPRRIAKYAWIAWAGSFISGFRSEPVRAQISLPCTSGVLSEIVVRTHSVYDAEEVNQSRFGWAYRWVNRLHFTTRPELVRGEMSIRGGDCFDAEAIAESARVLRALPFIARVETKVEGSARDGYVITVETWDEWTSTMGLSISIEGEVRFEGGFVTEENLLGRGLAAQLTARRSRELRDLGLGFGGTRLLGSRADWLIAGGTTRDGSYFETDLNYPFVGERGRFLLRMTPERRDHHLVYATGDLRGTSHVLIPIADRSLQVTVQRRSGEPGSLWVYGMELNALRRVLNGTVRSAERSDFGILADATPELVQQLGSFASPVSYLRLGVTGGIRRLRFRSSAGLDLIRGSQDVAVGGEWLVTIGRTLATWDDSGHDTYARFNGYLGGASEQILLQASHSVEARWPDQVDPGVGSITDIAVTTILTGYLTPRGMPAHTVFVQAILHGAWRETGWRSQPEMQNTLGGAVGVRSLVDYDEPVARRLILRLEERWNPDWLGAAAEVGFTLFTDVGRGWEGNAPFSRSTGWQSATGVGLRIGFPRESQSVLRVEYALPTGGGAADGGVLRAYWAIGITSR